MSNITHYLISVLLLSIQWHLAPCDTTRCGTEDQSDSFGMDFICYIRVRIKDLFYPLLNFGIQQLGSRWECLRLSQREEQRVQLPSNINNMPVVQSLEDRDQSWSWMYRWNDWNNLTPDHFFRNLLVVQTVQLFNLHRWTCWQQTVDSSTDHWQFCLVNFMAIKCYTGYTHQKFDIFQDMV